MPSTGLFPLRDRVVQVRCDRGDGVQPRWRVGSGLLIGGRLVLTAAHVAGPGTLAVRRTDQTQYPATALVTGPVSTADLALLSIDADARLDELPRLGFAAVDRDRARADVLHCWAVGYPRFQRIVVDGAQVRETVQVDGVIPTMEGLHGGLLTLQVTAAPRSLPRAEQALHRTAWSGMSGAVVVCDDRIVGVVTEHHPRRGESSLTLTPITHANRLADAETWWRALGVTPEHIERLPRHTAVPAYHSTLALIAQRTPVLLGREDELAELRAFATGTEGYRWLIGQPWAGKTALAAHLLQSCPSNVDGIGYFLQRRVSDSDSAHFVAAAVAQLCWLLDEEPVATPSAYVLTALWDRAVQRAERSGRHVLLVVDGLDEESANPGMPSVAATLPTRVGANAHVLVTGRTHPAVPADVEIDHPLRSAPRRQLGQTPQARHREQRAVQDLSQLTGPTLPAETRRTARAVLGVLAAAVGALAVDDLAAIDDLDPFDVESLLTGVAARVAEPVRDGPTVCYRFAHQSLLDQCRDTVFGVRRLEHFQTRVDKWVASWIDAGWPMESTIPRYLVRDYPGRLIARADWARLVRLVCDPGWLDVAVASAGVDEVRTVLRAAASALPDDSAVVRTFRILEQESWHLRSPRRVNQPGFVARQLCLAVVAPRGETSTADRLQTGWRDRVAAHRPPQLIPQWTSRGPALGLQRTLGEHDGGVCAVAAGRDGRYAVTGGGDGAVRLWDLTGDRAPRVLGRHAATVRTVGFSPVAAVVISAGDDGAVLVSEVRGAPRTRLIGHGQGGVAALAVVPDGRFVVAGGDDGELWIHSTVGRHRPRLLGVHEGGVTAVAVSPDGQQVISGGNDGSLRRWDWSAGAGSPGIVGVHDGEVAAVAVVPDGRHVVSGGTDAAVRVWDLDGRSLPRLLGVHDDWVLTLAVGRSGRYVVTGGRDRTIRAWSLDGQQAPQLMGEHNDEVSAVCLTPDDRRAISGGGRVIRLWDLAESCRALPPESESRRLQAIALTPDGRYAVACGNKTSVRAWDLTGVTAARTIGRHDGSVAAMAVSPDGQQVIIADDRVLRVWDGSGTAPPRVLGQHDGWVWAMETTPDGRFLVTGGDGSVQLWDITGSGPPRTLGEHDAEVLAVAVTPDGSRVVSASGDWTVRVWSLDENRPLLDFSRRNGRPQSLAVHPDGRQLVVGSYDGTVQVLDLANERPPRTLGAHPGPVLATAVPLAGRQVLTAASDGIRGWDLIGGNETFSISLPGVTALRAASVGSGAGGCLCVSLSPGCGLTAWRLLT